MEKSVRNLVIAGAVLLIIGLIGWVLQLTGGLFAQSGMTNIFLWGLMIAMFAFMVGFGAGSQIVATALYVWGTKDMRSLANKAAAIGLACVASAGVAILADLGAVRNVMAMIFGLNLRSPLAWDMLALTAFIVVSVIQLLVIARKPESAKVWTVIAGVFAVILQIVEGLLFSLQTSHAWWATPIMPVDFLAVAVVSGSVLMVLVAVATKQSQATVSWLARLGAVAIAVHLVLALIDLALVVFGGEMQGPGVLAAIGGNVVLYLCELLLPAIAMVMLFSYGKKGDVRACGIASVVAIVGIFCHRLMLLYPAYNAPSLYLTLPGSTEMLAEYPISTGRYLDWDTTFALGTPYAPAPAEWMAALLPIGFAIIASLVVLWAMKRLQVK